MRDAGHLSLLEHGAYRRLLDIYYVRSAALPQKISEIFRLVRAKTKSERVAVESILNEFFLLREDGWHNARCDNEIQIYMSKQRLAQQYGKQGGRPKKADSKTPPFSKNNPTLSESKPDPFVCLSEKKAHQTPDSRLQTKKDSVPDGTAPPSGAPPDNPARQELFDLVASTAQQFGLSDKRTRSIMGRAVKLSGGDHAAIVKLIRDCLKDPPLELEPWLMAACKPIKKLMYGMDDGDDQGNSSGSAGTDATALGSA